SDAPRRPAGSRGIRRARPARPRRARVRGSTSPPTPPVPRRGWEGPGWEGPANGPVRSRGRGAGRRRPARLARGGGLPRSAPRAPRGSSPHRRRAARSEGCGSRGNEDPRPFEGGGALQHDPEVELLRELLVPVPDRDLGDARDLGDLALGPALAALYARDV